MKTSQNALATAAVPQLFVLELNAGKIHVMNTDGSNRRAIVTGCHLPDGIAVDIDAGHIYWTNNMNRSPIQLPNHQKAFAQRGATDVPLFRPS